MNCEIPVNMDFFSVLGVIQNKPISGNAAIRKINWNIDFNKLDILISYIR